MFVVGGLMTVSIYIYDVIWCEPDNIEDHDYKITLLTDDDDNDDGDDNYDDDNDDHVDNDDNDDDEKDADLSWKVKDEDT